MIKKTKTLIRPISLIIALIFGYILSEYFYTFAKYSSYFLFAMLFLSMIRVDKFFHKDYAVESILVVFLPLIFGGIFYTLLSLILKNNHQILISAALIILSPLATTAVVMVKAINGNIAFAIMCIILSHFFTIIFWPIFSYLTSMKINCIEIAIKLSTMILVPFIFSRIVRKTKAISVFAKIEHLGFYLWIVVVFINIASISHLFKINQIHSNQINTMILISFLMILINYFGGLFCSKHLKFQTEVRQLFIQRNTVFGIWIANSFFTSEYAICSIFYLIFQNIYNTLKLINSK